MLSHAISYIGRGQKVDEWGDGRYLNSAIEKADAILRTALWQVEVSFRKVACISKN